MEWFLPLKTKVHAVLAGHSQLLVQWSLIGIFWEKVEILLSLNNNWLTVLETSITMDAMEDSHLMLSNISSMLEDYNLT